MLASVYDYTFQCKALEGLLRGATGPADRVLVTHWRGTEAVSRPYRLEITFATADAGLALEKLLDQPATLAAKTPDGGTRQWHGIITRAAEAGSDDTHHYYQAVLEPRLARLRNMHWSDIYLKRDLSDLIKQLLALAGLTDTYSSDKAPYDYRVTATQLDRTRSEFTCQYEETCLDFLMRKLEYYGVYFWFEQGAERESIVFANDVTQQPAQADTAIYYPKGNLEADARQIAVRRLARQVGLPPRTVVLHGHQDYSNTTLTLMSQANVPLPPAEAGLGEIHSVDDHFERVEGTGSISGATLAQWRAQELACARVRAEGEAATPGIRAGRFLDVFEYNKGSEARQYYVTEVVHEATQPVETSPRDSKSAYRATFAALPRWLDQSKPSAPLQYRPPRATPVPQVTRLLNGFIDNSDPAKPKRFAQPDQYGRYKVRFLFARQRYKGDQNSAFVRMATPYAGGASAPGLSNAGMHFPLREGTEVLLAFLRGEPDCPVIVAALPNVEAPSPVTAENPGQHIIATPAGNSLVLADTQPGGTDDKPYINAYSPVQKTTLNLGTSGDKKISDGFSLRTDGHGDIHAGTSMLLEVPGHYRVSAGGSDEVLANFLSSTKSFAPGISGTTTGGIVMTNFVGAKIDSVGGVAISNFFGLKANMQEAGIFDFTLGGKYVIDLSYTKKINPQEETNTKTKRTDLIAEVNRIVAAESNSIISRTEKLGAAAISATTSYALVAPTMSFSAAGAAMLNLNAAGAELLGAAVSCESMSTTTISSTASTTLQVGPTELNLTPANATLSGAAVAVQGETNVDVAAWTGSVFIAGPLVQIG
jgi:Rhs element Vgr protein